MGSQSFHQINPTDINPVYNRTLSSTQLVGKRVYASANDAQNYTNQIATTDTGGIASYHSLQASLQKQVSTSLTAFVNYTWSKALDNNVFGAQGVTAVTPGNGYVLPVYEQDYKRLDRGPSDYDHRNVLTVSYVYVTPKLTRGNALVRYAVNGWQTNSIYAIRSGNPLTIA